MSPLVFKFRDMPDGCAAGLTSQLREPGLMHEMAARRVDADGAHMIQSFDQAEHRRQLCGFRHLAQPSEPALVGFQTALGQGIQPMALFGG